MAKKERTGGVERRGRRKRNKGWSREKKHMKKETHHKDGIWRRHSQKVWQQEGGRGAVRELGACRNVSEKHGCLHEILRIIP